MDPTIILKTNTHSTLIFTMIASKQKKKFEILTMVSNHVLVLPRHKDLPKLI
jgi:hypothetical protein